MSNKPEGIQQEDMSGKADFYPTYIRMVKIHKELQKVKPEIIEKLGNFCVKTCAFSGETHIEGADNDMSCAIEGVLEGQMCVVAVVGNHYNLQLHAKGQENLLWAMCDKVEIPDVLNFINTGGISVEVFGMLCDEWSSYQITKR